MKEKETTRTFWDLRGFQKLLEEKVPEKERSFQNLPLEEEESRFQEKHFLESTEASRTFRNGWKLPEVSNSYGGQSSGTRNSEEETSTTFRIESFGKTSRTFQKKAITIRLTIEKRLLSFQKLLEPFHITYGSSLEPSNFSTKGEEHEAEHEIKA